MGQIITKENIKNLDRKVRLNLVNNLGGVKPANLVGTRSLSGQSNLAIMNSVMHIGSDPAMMDSSCDPPKMLKDTPLIT